MLMKKLTALLACVCILATFATTSVSAAGATDPAYPGWHSSGTPWGNSYPEYAVKPYRVGSWGGHTVATAKNEDGYCMRLTCNGGGNWIYLGPYQDTFTVGTTYVASFDYKRGPYEYFWPNIKLKLAIGGVEHRLPSFDGTDYKEWTTHTWEFTATGKASPVMTFDENKNGDLYIDNFIVKEKETGKVIYENDFNLLQTSQSNWGYNPGAYAETTVASFYNWPTNDYIGVIERGTGYAVYVRNTSGYDIFWNSPALNEKLEAAVVDGETYTISYDYVACDGNGWPNLLVANAKDWIQDWSGTCDGAWHTYTNTLSSAQAKGGYFGWKFLNGCKICVDNLKITDSLGNVVVEETFDLVPAWNAPSEYFADEIEIAQTGSDIEASVDVTNSYADTKNPALITAIYDGNELLSVDITIPDVVGDPTEVNHVTTISHKMTATGYSGKTFAAFLWDSLSGLKALTDAKAVTIE